MTKKDSNKEKDKVMNRRNFIKNTGILAGGVVGGSFLGGLLTKQFTTEDVSQPSEETPSDYNEARIFFDRWDDFVVLRAAVERIYPEDDNGPGAIQLGVPYFIDRQLAGAWGLNAKEYMLAPFTFDAKKDNSGSRYETGLNRGQIFIQGIRKIDELSEEKFDTNFSNADGEQQDEILQLFDNGEVTMDGVSSKTFFNFLRKMTLEGVYSDPLYGGNKNMEGWKMVDYPGPRPGFIDIIEDEEFVKMDPFSLTDYQPS